MWIDNATKKKISLKNIAKRGFSTHHYSPQNLHVSSFLFFLISNERYDEIEKLELLANENDPEKIEAGIKEILKFWESL